MSFVDGYRQVLDAMPADIREAHRHSSKHRDELMASALCGCFYCCETFRPEEICEWTDLDANGVAQTAMCPLCGIDSVLGSESGYELSAEFLGRMRRYWF